MVDIIDRQSVTLKQYRSALETYVRGILGNLEQNRGKMFLINSPMGSGKTYTMGNILSEVSHSVLWLGLYHDTLTELWEGAFANIPKGQKQYIKGLSQHSAISNDCVLLKHEGNKSDGSRKYTCKVCKISARCTYRTQFHGIQRKSHVIAPQSYLKLKHFEKLTCNRDIIVFDEDFTQKLFQKTTIHVKDISRLQTELGTQIRNGEAPRVVLEYLNAVKRRIDLVMKLYYDTSKKRNAADKTIFDEDTYSLYSPITVSLPGNGGNVAISKYIRGLSYYSILSQLAIASKEQKQIGVNTQRGYLYFYSAPTLPRNAMYIVLDTTGNAQRLGEVMKRAWSDCENISDCIEKWGNQYTIDWNNNPGSTIYAVADSFSKRSLINTQKSLAKTERLFIAIRKKHKHKRISLISYSEIVKSRRFKSLRDRLKVHSSGYFYYVRGNNQFQSASVMVVLGSPIPSMNSFCQMTRDYFGDPSIPDIPSRILLRWGDDIPQQLHMARDQFCVAELVQAIGRSRYVRKERVVYLLCSKWDIRNVEKFIHGIQVISRDDLLDPVCAPKTKTQVMLVDLATELLRYKQSFTIADLVKALERATGKAANYEVVRRNMQFVQNSLSLEVSSMQNNQSRGKPPKVYSKSGTGSK